MKHKNLFNTIVFSITFLYCILTISAQDKFADIGTQAYDLKNKGLITPQPIPLPSITVPTANNPKAKLKVVNPISTQQELDVEMDKLRARYIPFMQQLAPKVTEQRQRIALTEFDWRIATHADSTDFATTLQGAGKWTKISIPHYAPPLGRATTFYRKEMELTKDIVNHDAVFLHFKGVDYKAHVFVNGNFCGSHEGFFAPFEFEISNLLKVGKNTIVVKVENDFPTTPNKDDKGNVVAGDKIYAATGPGYDDPILGWHHGPAAMGIYQDCYLETRANIHINDIFVRPLVEKSAAEAWVEVNNFKQYPEGVKLKISVYGQNFNDTVLADYEYVPSTVMIPGVGDLAKPTDNEKRILKMGHGVNFLRIPLDMKGFRYWNNENPWLYQIQIKLYDQAGKLTDTRVRQFGMRSFTMDTVSIPKGKMFLNGQTIRLRGANTMGFEQQSVMRKDWNRLRDDILLAKACNMNYLRFTQRPVQEEVLDFCDQLGLMNQIDLPLFGSIRRNKITEAIRQVEEMERLGRSHPSVIVASYINERFPNAEGNPQRSLNTAAEYFQFFKALDQVVLLNNPDRVIKAGDGDYDPPTPGLPDSHCYNTWYNGHGLGIGEMYKGYWQPVKPDWYYACGEFGAEGLDPWNTMQKYYPKEWLPKNAEDEKSWTANRISMSQTHRFHYMWYNTQHTVKDWINASQEYQAWAVKFVSETFRRDPRMVSFAIHLFIDAWPAGWMKTIMDVDRQPKKAFFAYRNALQPLISTIRCDRSQFFAGETAPFELFISNDLNTVPENFKLNYQLEQNGKVIFSNQINANIPSNSTQFQGFFNYKVPVVKARTAYTLRTALIDGNGKSMQQNSFDFDVFPTEKAIETKVFVAGKATGKAALLMDEMGVKTQPTMQQSDVLIFDDFEGYNTIKEEVDALVNNGKTVLFLELPANKYHIASTEVAVEKTSMGNYYFVSPTTGHALMKDFQPFDFRFWYNSKLGYIAPFISNVVSAPAWTPIITSGATNWMADKGQMSAVMELNKGTGKYIICELQLLGKLKANPTAALFLSKLLNYK